jgi:ABC-type transport system involved in multi-copper enzyme maturation permease subunit
VTDNVVFDRGYRRYEGPRRGLAGARAAVVRDGLRRVLGLRRKVRRKIMPWSLLAVALLMAAIFIGLHFFASQLPVDMASDLPRYAELFDFFSWIGILFIALAGPTLLIPDRTQGVLSVYFSRPLTVGAYLQGKLIAFVGVTALIYLGPLLALHLGLAFLSPDGFLGYLGANLDVLWKIPVVSLGYLALHGGLITAISAVVNRTGAAAAVFLGILTAGGSIASRIGLIEAPGVRYATLAALDQHPRAVRDWIFGIDGVTYPVEQVGFSPWVSVATIAVVAVAGLWWVHWRYRRLA